jgi:hypothetical protein
MKKWLVLAGAFFLLGGSSGCAGDPHGELVKRMIAEVNKAADSLEEIDHAKDKVEAAKAQAKTLRDVGQKLIELKVQADALKEPLDSAEKKRLADDYEQQFKKALDRVSLAWDKIKGNKGVRDTLKKEHVLDYFGFNG